MELFVLPESRMSRGKHVAIVDDKVVGVGDSAREAYETAKRRFPKESPLLVYIPTGETLIL